MCRYGKIYKFISSNEELETWIGITWLIIWKMVGCCEDGNGISGLKMQGIL
jgi:hypothetical protein